MLQVPVRSIKSSMGDYTPYDRTDRIGENSQPYNQQHFKQVSQAECLALPEQQYLSQSGLYNNLSPSNPGASTVFVDRDRLRA